MGGDFGLYSALRGTDNWAQKRQDKMQSLMIAGKRDQNAQAELKQSMELEAGMQKQFDEMGKLDALAADQGRINDAEKSARRKVYRGIAAANGNLKAYMSSGGISAISEYKRSVMNSEAAKNAGSNKANYASWIKDQSEGKFIKGVNIEVPVMRDGKVVMDEDTGKPKTQMKNVSMQEQAALFQKGIIKTMSYGGAEDVVKIDMFDFSDHVKDKNNPYHAAKVMTSDIETNVMSQGGSLEQARARSRDYANNIAAGGSPWRWGNEDINKALYLQSKIQKSMSKGNGKSSSSKTVTTNALPTALQAAATSTAEYGATVPFGPGDEDMWSELYNLSYDSETKSTMPVGIFNIVDINNNDVTYDGSSAINVEFLNGYVGKNGRKYVPVKTTFLADDPKANTPHQESSFLETNSIVHDKTNKGNWVFSEMPDGTDIVTGIAYMDVTDKIDNSYSAAGINKKVGQKSAQDNAPASVNREDMREQTEKGGQAIAKMVATGMSHEDAMATYKRKLDSQQAKR